MKVFILTICFYLLYSCAAKKLAVKHADTFITHSVEKKLPLNPKQEAQLAKDVDHFLMKKKPKAQELLPLLDKMDPSNPTLFEEIYDSLLVSYRGVAQDFSELLAKYIVDLDEKQLKTFFKKLSDDRKEKEKKDKEARLSDLKRKVEKLFGALTKEQEKFLQSHADYFQRKGDLQLKRKEKLHDNIESILGQKQSLETKKELVVKAFMNYQDESIESSKENLPLVKEFSPTLSQKQKEFFREKVRDLKEIIGYYLEAQY